MTDLTLLDRKREKELEKLELELEQRRGRLVPVEFAAEEISRLLDGVRERLLYIPTQLEDEAISRRVRALIIQALEEVQEQDETTK